MASTLSPHADPHEIEFIGPRGLPGGEESGPDQQDENEQHEHVAMEPPSRRSRWLRARPDDPAWARPALLALLVGTGLLYIWGLGASGWSNSFYSAAAQAGSQSWKALFFGSNDASNFITVDKPPVAFWAQGLSTRIFGYSTATMLLPEVILGVGSVLILHHLVRRWRGDVAAQSGLNDAFRRRQSVPVC